MGFYTAIEGLDFYRGEINAEWGAIRDEIWHLYEGICLAENAAGVEDNTFGSEDLDEAYEQFELFVNKVLDKIDNHRHSKGENNND
jgi:hypothetical protein